LRRPVELRLGVARLLREGCPEVVRKLPIKGVVVPLNWPGLKTPTWLPSPVPLLGLASEPVDTVEADSYLGPELKGLCRSPNTGGCSAELEKPFGDLGPLAPTGLGK